jgi:hypothetical protein
MNSSVSTLLRPWGGFRACEFLSDCFVNNSTGPDFPMLCVHIKERPSDGTFCLCDLGLGGHECDELTLVAHQKLLLFVAVGVLAAITTSFCVVELHRLRARPKLSPLVISLYLGVVGCFLGTTWCVVGLITMLDPENPNVPFLREFQFLFVIPAAVSLPLASVLVISLAWQKVLVQAQVHKRNNKGIIPITANTQRNLVIFANVLMFGGSGSFIVIGKRAAASLLVCFLYGVSAVFVISNGRKLGRVMRASTRGAQSSPRRSSKLSSLSSGDTSAAIETRRSLSVGPVPATNAPAKKAKPSKLERVCLAARIASRDAAAGMILMFFSTLGFALASTRVGYTSSPNGVEWMAIILTGIQLGSTLTALAAVNYAKKAGPRRRDSDA